MNAVKVKIAKEVTVVKEVIEDKEDSKEEDE